MIERINALLGAACVAMSCAATAVGAPRHYVLTYDKPATAWEEALPLGSGHVGAMVWGGVANERVDLNEDTIWSGSPNSNVNPDFNARLGDIRRAIFSGDWEAANPARLPGARNHGMKYQCPGSLKLDFDGLDGEAENYSRTLSLASASSRIRFMHKGVRHDRAAFTPLDKGGLVYSARVDAPGRLSFKISLERAHKDAAITVEDGVLTLRGVTSGKDGVPGKVRYTVKVAVRDCDGVVSAEGESLHVGDATSARVYVAIGTNFINYDNISADADAAAARRLAELLSIPAKELFSRHRSAYEREIDRCTLDLGPDRYPAKTTDRRLADYATTDDPYFAALYFTFGRYLLICSSRPGSQPANLQGVWNNSLNPPWGSKYTININTEMNYWPGEVTNLPRECEPLFEMIRELSVTGAKTAAQMYGAKGWTAHHNTDIWRVTGPVDTFLACGWWPSGGGWLSTHIWQHWLFSRDRAFLERHYNVLKGAAEFYDSFAVENPATGRLAFVPSNSPENIPAGRPNGFDAVSTMDHAIARDVWQQAIDAAKELGRDAAFAAHLQERLKRLEPYHIGKWGQLQEWGDDLDRQGDKHRHVSHLYGLYPSAQITPETPELFAAARKSLEARGDVSTGWAMGWRVCLWARLLDGDHALRLIKNQLSPLGRTKGGGGTYPNLFDAHPPFQIDGNFGCAAGIAEMLVQSHRGFVELLPALPSTWQEGSVTGIRARGDWTLDFSWRDGLVTECFVKAGAGGKLTLKINGRLETIELERGAARHLSVGRPAAAKCVSPDRRMSAKVAIRGAGELVWRVEMDGRPVMDGGRLGVVVNGTDLGAGVSLGEPAMRSGREKYEFFGNHRFAEAAYNEYIFPVKSLKSGDELMKVELRVFNDGAAVRYRFAADSGERRIDAESTEWTAPAGSTVWFQSDTYCYEGEFERHKAGSLPEGRVAALPVTLKLADGQGYALYTEANLVNYTDLATKCRAGRTFAASFEAREDRGGFVQRGEGVSPWRVVMAARDLNAFFGSDIVKNLCPPANKAAEKIAKPGRAVWHWLADGGPKFAEQKSWIDRTAALGYEYYLVDEGWSNWKEPGRRANDCIREIVEYASSKGVKIAVWRHSGALFDREARRGFFREMRDLGVVAVKPDFPADTGIKWVNWYEDTLADAAEFGLMIDFHGALKPTGRERTWPNEVAREAIRGHEWHVTRYNRVLPPWHDCILPFNRLVQGHADYTPAVLNARELVGYTRARELAQAVVFSAPFLCTGDYPQNYLDSPAVDFMKAVPAVYDETRVLAPSEVGEIAVFAKRAGDRWFIAVENGLESHEFDIPLGFLGGGKWRVVSFSDSDRGPTEMRRGEQVFSSRDSLHVKVRPSGGFAAFAVPL